MQFAVNHLAYFLLTNLLLDRLAAGAPARVVNVSSRARIRAGPSTSTISRASARYDPVRVYGRTKLANVLFTYELARRIRADRRDGQLPPSRGHRHAAAGGLHERAAGRRAPSAHTFGAAPAEGADTIVYLAASPEVERVTGRYFVGNRESRSSPASYDESLQRRLWEESVRLTAAGRLRDTLTDSRPRGESPACPSTPIAATPAAPSSSGWSAPKPRWRVPSARAASSSG